MRPGGGYTFDPRYAMRSPDGVVEELLLEPEPLSKAEQSDLSARARSFFEITRAEEIAKAETRSRCNRLRELEGEARRRSVDPTRAVTQIERGMSMLEQLVRGTIAAT
jgi:hypothetical protein